MLGLFEICFVLFIFFASGTIVYKVFREITYFEDPLVNEGEKFVARKLLGLDPNHYKILNNLMLPSQGNTSYTQIDHVVVSNYGVFSIETKDYSGYIIGNAKNENWINVTYKYNNKYQKKFYNPLRQNYAHEKALQTLIQLYYHNVKIYSLVAFPLAAKIYISGTDKVGYAGEIIQKIKSQKVLVFSDIERDKIFEVLNNFNNKEEKITQEHIQEVQNISTKMVTEKVILK